MLADQRATILLEAVVLAAEVGDVHQPVDLQALELHKEAKAGDAGDDAVEVLADALAHELALQERDHVARGLVGAALAQRAVLAERRHLGGTVAEAVGAAAREHVADRAMRQQVGVAANGRCEMRVLAERQPEVTDVLRLVRRLRQRADDHALEHRGVGAALHLLQELGQTLRVERALGVEQQATGREETLELENPFLVRLRVHPVEPGHLVALQESRSFDVGGDHAFLDQPVRVVARVALELGDAAVRPDEHLDLGRLEVERPALLAPLPQRPVDLVQRLERGQHRRRQCAARGRVALDQRRRRLRIGQPRRRAQQRRIELRACDATVVRDVHLAHESGALDFRHQRTEVIRQLLRQHRQHPVREIDAGRARVRVGIECGPRLHVMADIGDRHQQPPAAAAGLGVDRIVEVARVLAVNGRERDGAQVNPGTEACGLDALAKGACLAQRLRRKFVRQLVRGDRELDRGRRHSFFRQHPRHPADRIGVAARRVHELGDHQLPVGGAAARGRRDRHPVANAAVVGLDEADAAFLVIAAGDLADRALQHLDDLGFAPAPRILTGRAHRDAIAMHDLAHLRRRQVQVVGAVVRHEEAKTVTMTHDLAAAHRDALGQQVLLAPVLQQLAVADHRREALVERGFKSLVLEFECGGEAGRRQRRAGLGKRREQILATRDRPRVALGLILLPRIRVAPMGLFVHRFLL